MNETPAINLLATNTITVPVACQLPGDGADVWRDFPFKATFKVLTEDAQEALDDQELTRGDFLREVVVSVDGIPGAKDPATGEDVQPKEVAIRNIFTMDAMWGAYLLNFTRNSRQSAQQASAPRKNSKRSRKR